jgi:hypothetical protein
MVTCDYCGKDFEELITRQGFCQTFYVEWVCEGCFKELEGRPFEDYKLEAVYE